MRRIIRTKHLIYYHDTGEVSVRNGLSFGYLTDCQAFNLCPWRYKKEWLSIVDRVTADTIARMIELEDGKKRP